MNRQGSPSGRPLGIARTSLASAMACLAALSLAVPASADDWPHYQGPNGNGTSNETALNFDWPEEGPPELWKHEIGPGFGGAAIRDGRVYLLDREPGELDLLRCYDLVSGEEIWSEEWEVAGRLSYQGSRQVPWVSEDLVYGVGGFGNVYCVDRETGETEWTLDLQEDYDAPLPMFGFALSPVVHEDFLILAPMAEDCGLLALDRFTGEEIWSTGDVGTSHSTPHLMEIDGELQVLFVSSRMPDFRGIFSGGERGERRGGSFLLPDSPPARDGARRGTGLVTAFDPEEGTQIWQSELFFCSLPIPIPIKIDEEHLFLTAGYGAGSMLMELKHEGDEWTSKSVFESEKGAQIHIPMLVDGHLYTLVNENDNDPRPMRRNGGLQCLDLAGNEKWRTGDDPFFGRGCMIQAAGKLIIQDGHSGILRVVEPNPEAYTPIAEANVFDSDGRGDDQMWAPMALSNGLLVLRSQDELRCLDLRAASGQ